eukprot:CAMPEP_0170529256 /NCGR_PEP_ID=MMETSP0209-20121228/19228_1 /TAXON_ID=665100 ORGANISM="Litonotus pictus, Strain P1" /NCGR_SAMPLE_ID=MMETSP0209 /ASSEMBLY_ACC=CAM_ASM_000301 /LENGTH=447 /DNA_ID=CAMNT_0010821001 /DNA_START=66 /DNA_END=1409 /DNA_ORIENTATION=-
MRLVFSLLSNGAKAPDSESLNGLKEDVFGERWEQPGELTAVGMRQHYLLGNRNRQRYSSLISPSFDVKEVLPVAIERNSTLSSLEAYLQGLYPQSTGPNLSGYQKNVAYPQGKAGLQAFSQEILQAAPALPYNTQVFPVHTFMKKDWKYFFMYDDKVEDCEDLYYEMVDNQKTDATVQWLSDFKTKYSANLTIALGFSNDKVLEDYTYVHRMMKDFMSGFYEGKLHKRLIDAGINIQDFNQTATDFLNYNLYNVQNSGEYGYLANATFSTFGEEMLDWMDLRIELDQANIEYDEETQPPKMIIYSVDDVVLASLMKYLQEQFLTKIHYVPYGSSLYFELIRPDGKDSNTLTEFDYFVDIIFNDSPLKTISYAEFQKYLEDAWSYNKLRWKCSKSPWDYWGFKNATITLGILFVIVFITLIVVLCCWCCRSGKGEELNEQDDNKVQAV